MLYRYGIGLKIKMLERFGVYLEPKYRQKITSKEQMKAFHSKKLTKRYFRPYVFLKFRKMLNHVYNNSEFYNSLFKKSNISPSDIKKESDIAKIPFTTSLDILEPEKFFCVPKDQFVKTFETSGTTGKPKITYLTKEDVDDQIFRNAIGMRCLYDINSKDTARIYYGSRYAVYYCAFNAFKQIGAEVISSQNRLAIDKEYETLKKNKVNTIIGNPSFFYSLSTELDSKYNLHNLNVKSIILGAEPLAESSRKKLENIWNANVYSAYGINELGVSIAGECEQRDGIHVTETDFYVEVVDPKTGERLEDGEKGEFVFTTIGRKGMPLVRYRSNDIGYIMPEVCPCGLLFKKIKIDSRLDDMIILGYGENIYPVAFEEAIFGVEGIVDFQIIINRNKDIDNIKILIETTDGKRKKETAEEVLERVLKIGQIKRGINDSKIIETPVVEIVKQGSIKRSSMKAKRITDNRKLYNKSQRSN